MLQVVTLTTKLTTTSQKVDVLAKKVAHLAADVQLNLNSLSKQIIDRSHQ